MLFFQDYEYFSSPSRPAPAPARGVATTARKITATNTTASAELLSAAAKKTELPATIMFGDSRQPSPASTVGKKSGASLASLYQVALAPLITAGGKFALLLR
jgi:hypothetical protein